MTKKPKGVGKKTPFGCFGYGLVLVLLFLLATAARAQEVDSISVVISEMDELRIPPNPPENTCDWGLTDSNLDYVEWEKSGIVVRRRIRADHTEKEYRAYLSCVSRAEFDCELPPVFEDVELEICPTTGLLRFK